MRTIAVKVKQLWGGRKVTSISANMTTIVDTYRRSIHLSTPSISHLETKGELGPIVSRIIPGDLAKFFPLSLVTVAEVFAKELTQPSFLLFPKGANWVYGRFACQLFCQRPVR